MLEVTCSNNKLHLFQNFNNWTEPPLHICSCWSVTLNRMDEFDSSSSSSTKSEKKVLKECESMIQKGLKSIAIQSLLHFLVLGFSLWF